MNFPRAGGILLHPTSLPNDFGIGDFGGEAFEFIDYLASAGQTYWQVLPLGQTGYGDSPYQCFSAFAGNVYLISPQKLYEHDFLTKQEIENKPNFPEKKVDYGAVIKWKKQLLEKAHNRAGQMTDEKLGSDFRRFCEEKAFWLDDYAVFRALKTEQDQKSWLEWDEELRFRNENALRSATERLQREIEAEKFYQFLFFHQWREIKNYCAEKRIKIIGDVPIFVALDSVDVWAYSSEFKLNEDRTPRVVAGVPPDYFSKTGQLWGNPIYDWEQMRNNNFGWWTARMKAAFELFDVVRLDHFRGFSAVWEVPSKDETAENGNWVNAPGAELFFQLKQALGEASILAEDLGVITFEVEVLRDHFNFPGMKILQYAFGGDANNSYLPHNYGKNSAVYTGTHDNDTVVGWFEQTEERVRRHCLEYLVGEGEEINWDLIRAAFASVADTAIVPMQDVLGLGNEAKMNTPATEAGNWQWRCEKKDFNEETARRLRKLSSLYGRLGNE